MQVFVLPALKDNYNFVIYDEATKTTAVVDPSGVHPTDHFLQERGWDLHFILNTHQHPDHVGGNLELKEKYNCQVIASQYDRNRIPGFDRGVEEGANVQVGQLKAKVLFIPGHTKGHIAYYFPKHNNLFCGDTLFSMGCGRLFEGTPGELFNSLKRIQDLPLETMIYCAHEYTLKNGQFALQFDPHNKFLQNYYNQAVNTVRQNQSTIPFQLLDQLQCNPFLRTHRKEIAQQLSLKDASNELEVFTLLRQKKDFF